MKIIAAITLTVALLMSCSTPVVPVVIVFTNQDPSATLQLLLSDRYECLQEASADGGVISGVASSTRAVINGSSGLTCNSSVMNACLAARGWLRDDTAVGNNAFTVPQGAVVYCSR